jgi:hypothetical protein
VHAAAAYLGVNHRTLYRALRGKPTTAVLQGLVLLPYPDWAAMPPAEARQWAEQRMAMWVEPLGIAHGEARRMAAEWRQEWLQRADGCNLLERVHGKRGKAKKERRTA